LVRVINYLGFEKFKEIYNGDIDKSTNNEINPLDILDTLNHME
jgi:hypothetical protein